MQVGYEIDSEGNVGNETRRIEDLQLRFILLMAIIPLTIKDGRHLKMSEQSVKSKGLPFNGTRDSHLSA